jgi:hypothetical protein
MILGTDMQPFENILYEEDERAITGFINSSGELAYSVYRQVDGGCIDLDNRDYDKNALLELLEIELKNFTNRNLCSTVILGHSIYIVTVNRKHVFSNALDDEVYDISQSILDGSDNGDIFVESLNVKAYWNIVQ